MDDISRSHKKKEVHATQEPYAIKYAEFNTGNKSLVERQSGINGQLYSLYDSSDSKYYIQQKPTHLKSHYA